MTTIKLNETYSSTIGFAKEYISENFGSMANCDNNGIITVLSTSASSGWGKATSEENAKEVLDSLHSDEVGFTKASI